MRKTGVVCKDCKSVFEIDLDNLLYYQNFEINPYTCPNCGSINCRNMTEREVNDYNCKVRNITNNHSTKKRKKNTGENLDRGVDVQSVLDELNSYIGLKKVKDEIKNLVKLIKVREKRKELGLKNPVMTYHLCFLGNPGTGKTTIARIVGKLYKGLGILTKGQLVEVSRQDLVAGYVGQTAIKTKEIIDKSKGGILFIDEAYSLTNKSENDFGFEAIEVLLKEMEDNRDDFVVIVAGYDNLMNDFLESNPGLKSRFNTFIHFEDYSSNELADIIEMQCSINDYIISKEVKNKLIVVLKKIVSNKDENFSNARYARNLFENAVKKQSVRVAELEDCDKDALKEINIDDFLNLDGNSLNTN